MNGYRQRLGIAAFWIVWPGLWLYLRWSRRTRVLLTVGDEVLVCKAWLGDGRWGLPGGGLHSGEDPALGVVRELREETGIVLQPAALRVLGSQQYRGRGLRFACSYFAAELPAKPELQLQPYEISSAKWVSRAELAAAGSRQYGPDVRAALAMLQ